MNCSSSSAGGPLGRKTPASGVYLCFCMCDTVVAPADAEQECPCGTLSRDRDGGLEPLTERDFVTVYRVA